MQGLSKVVNTNGVTNNGGVGDILDFIFGRNCIILNDISKIFGEGINIPMPLLGFEYVVPDRVQLLNFSYSEAPYLNRSSVVNGNIKNSTRFTLRGVKSILKSNFITNYATNELLYYLLDTYITRGGIFTIVTPFATLGNCVCEDFSGIKLSDRDPAGQCFEFTFLKLNIQPEKISNSVSNYLNNITSGVAIWL